MDRAFPLVAATSLIDERFPESTTAFVAGSVIRGDSTPTSDLDIVVITGRPEAPFRESLTWRGWPVELFVHTVDSLAMYFDSDAKGRAPILQAMCLHGAVLRDHAGLAATIQDNARRMIDAGPASLTADELTSWRYFLTDVLDDFIGADDRAELLFIAPHLADRAAELLLGRRGQWLGKGKWLLRALRAHDPAAAANLIEALQGFYCRGEKEGLVRFSSDVLAEAGGRLFDGYTSAGRRSASPGAHS